MENDIIYKYIKYTIFTLFALWIIAGSANAQLSYGRYDSQTTEYEDQLVKAKINYNNKNIELLKEQQQSSSLFTSQGSINRSRTQALINAKENENFRLNQKSFALKDSKIINDKERFNSYRRQYPLYKISEANSNYRGSYRLSKSAEEFNNTEGQAVYAEELK